MEQIEIKSFSDKLFVAFKDLYSISFPIFEQRTEAQQMKAFTCPDYHLLCFVENEVFIGFIAYWELEHCLYIEHFAIHQLLRGKGYGSRVLKEYLKMLIKQVSTNKKQFLSLLLLADEQESMIDRYLDRGDLFVMYVDEATWITVAVVTEEEEGVYELKNLAVDPAYQRKGIGRQMVDFLCRHYQQTGHTLLVGTGDSRQTVSFYQSCGFTY